LTSPGEATSAPTASSSHRIAAHCTRTATGCSAQSRTPTTRSRRRCSAPGAASDASNGEARSAPGSTRSQPTAACSSSHDGHDGGSRPIMRQRLLRIRRQVSRYPSRCGSSPTRTSRSVPTTSPRRRRHATRGVNPPLPGRSARPPPPPPPPPPPLRGARERRARVRRDVPTPASAPTRRPAAA
jgi:hypothetical protein